MPKPLRRFLVDDLSGEKPIHLSKNDSHHLRHVLRLKYGDLCLLSDAKGREAEAEVKSFLSDGTAELFLKGNPNPGSSLNKAPIVVAQALPQKGIMDVIVEKAGELGVGELVPMVTERTQVHPTGMSLERVLARWQRIAHETAKQSGNPPASIPSISSFAEVLAKGARENLSLFLAHTKSDVALEELFARGGQVITGKNKILVLIGPEGGFSEKEILLARTAGANIFSLPGGILRTDTAFVSIVSLFRYHLMSQA